MPPRAGRPSVTNKEHHIFIPTAGARSLISPPKLCTVIEDVETIKKVTIVFLFYRRTSAFSASKLLRKLLITFGKIVRMTLNCHQAAQFSASVKKRKIVAGCGKACGLPFFTLYVSLPKPGFV